MKQPSRVGREIIIAALLALVVVLLPRGNAITEAETSTNTPIAASTGAGTPATDTLTATPTGSPTGAALTAAPADTTDSATLRTVRSCDQAGLTRAIAAAGSGGTVRFATDCPATAPLTLTSPITLSWSLTIDGNGHNVAISGANSVQVLYVSSGVSVTLKSVSITDGSFGGPASSGDPGGAGIYNAGTLTLTDSAVSGNSNVGSTVASGGGIYNAGTLALTGSTVGGNTARGVNGYGYGGGIYNTGMLALTGSTVAGNSAFGGGGIDNVGTLAVAGSAFSGNTAYDRDGPGSGGGIDNTGTVTVAGTTLAGNSAGDGGGIDNGGTLIVTGTTLAGNSAEYDGGGIYNTSRLAVADSTLSGNGAFTGGGIDNAGTLTVAGSTFSGNSAPVPLPYAGGGGIYTDGALALANSILADSGTGGDCRIGSASGAIADGGGNLADDASCSLTAASSGGSVAALDLGALADNGGELAGAPGSAAVVQTIALQPGSAAVGYGVLAACQAAQPGGAGGVDERGLPRGTTACDSGAYEVQGGPAPSSTPTASPTSGAAGAATGNPTATATATAAPPTATSTTTPTATATRTPADGASFATSFEHGQPRPSRANAVDSGGYPAGGLLNIGGICCGTAGPEAGVRDTTAHTGVAALLYAGKDTSAAGSYAYLKLFDLAGHPLAVGPSTTLSYWIYPQSGATSPAPVSGANSTCVAIDLIFAGGSNLRDSGAVDQAGHRLHPAYQCGRLALDAWNHVTSNIGAVAAGKAVVRIDVGYDQPANTGGYRGYVDDLSIR